MATAVANVGKITQVIGSTFDVEFDGDDHRIHYIRRPFRRDPDFGVTSVNYNFAELIDRAEPPA